MPGPEPEEGPALPGGEPPPSRAPRAPSDLRRARRDRPSRGVAPRRAVALLLGALALAAPARALSAVAATSPWDVAPDGPVAGPAEPLWGLTLALASALFLAGLCSTLSAALLRSLPTTLDPAAVGREASAELRRHLGGDLEWSERLAASASVAAFVLRAASIVFFHQLVVRLVATGPTLGIAITAVAGGGLVHVATQSIPLAIAQSHSDRLLVQAVPVVAPALRPFGWLNRLLRAVRLPLLRLFKTPDASYGTRRLVEGFRALVEEAELQGDLGEGTQELIANVIEFSAADAAEVMTPRTEIRAIGEHEPLEAAIAVFAEAGYSRIPVYRETIDQVVGTLTALAAAQAVAEGRVETTRIADAMRPPMLIPETKFVPELLADFRRERQKMAIVLDEYGGTAGLVTLADVMAEILGVVEDEYVAPGSEDFQRLECGRTSADASLHVSEVNEELDLEIPEEEDFETLAGFVLSEFGRFPLAGESFEKAGVHYEVLEASDRRVFRVAIRPPGVRAQAAPAPSMAGVPRRTAAGPGSGPATGPAPLQNGRAAERAG